MRIPHRHQQQQRRATAHQELDTQRWLFLLVRMLVLMHYISIWTATTTTTSAAASLPSSNNKHSHHVHTRMSGFGSRSPKKTIFFEEKENNDTTNSSSTTTHTLWVRRNAAAHDGGHRLLFRSSCVGDDKNNSVTISVTLNQNGEWHAAKVEEEESGMNTTTTTSSTTHKHHRHHHDDEPWIAVAGIYGVYSVPSGMIWVLITKTDPVYSEWNIHRVHGLELVHVGYHASGSDDTNSTSASSSTTTRSSSSSLLLQRTQRLIKEEARQVRLLRHAMRHHQFYAVINNDHNKNNNSAMPLRDMTHSWQRALEYRNQTSQTGAGGDDEWWESSSSYRPDARFFWNEPSVEPLLQKYQQSKSNDEPNNRDNNAYRVLLKHVIPVTSAFVGIQSNVSLLSSTNLSYDEILISRRSRFRAGTRFTKRGADGRGAVANYAETEQIVCLRNNATTKTKDATPSQSLLLLSHVQTRGSIPLRWSSPADVKTYRPRVRIGTDPLAQARAVRSHLRWETDLYADYNDDEASNTPQLVFVNLIDKKKDQGRLGRAFDAVLQAVLDVYTSDNYYETAFRNTTVLDEHMWRLAPNMVRHVWFDFHAEVKNGRWDRLGSLLKKLSPVLEEQGYLCVLPDKNWTVVSKQRGVVRTNCMDCLDRTNVVQSLFGRYMLYRQLSECGHYVTGTTSSKRSLPLEYAVAFRRNSLALPWDEGEVAHRFLWADNADAISRLYAGTPALKGDFTRTGKRTKRGALDDGMNSLQRYYLNNFLDADRQEGMDLMVGHADFSTDDTTHIMQETTRSILLGDASDDRHHVVLKSPREAFASKRLRHKGGASAFSPNNKRFALDLRWLPGDLQSHMKSHASNVLTETQQALEAMDRRSASDVPWWVTADESSGSEEEDEDDENSSNPLTTSSSTAYLIGCLVAAMQAPTVTAASVVAMLGLAGARRRSSKDSTKES